MAALAAWHYASHFREPQHLHHAPPALAVGTGQRCLTLPCWTLGCLIGAAALLLICFAV